MPYGRGDDPRHTALLGGLAAHALDYDDVDDATISHPSAVLVPTLLALSEQLDVTGAEVLDAYWVGLASGRLLGSAIGITSHYNQGWHSTATVGTVGAAAAAARLLGLDAERTTWALGIAGSLAAGSRQNFGTMTKPLHAGTAAANAVLAGRLAAHGFTADAEQLDGPLGFLALHSTEDGTPTATDADLELLGLNVKLYPCCYYTHSAADSMVDLAASGLRPEDVAAVEVVVQPHGLAPLIHSRPTTGLEGKFSMEYVMAAALLDGGLSLTSFTDEAVARPATQELIPRVTTRTAETPPVGPGDWKDGYAVVLVDTHDGRRIEHRTDRPRGHASWPVDETGLRQKFDDCVQFGGFAPSDGLFNAIRSMGAAPSMSDLLQQVRGELHTSTGAIA
jgi:2-methylcitrate dehydratase PrpD